MNRETIIQMARDAGLKTYPEWMHGTPDHILERFTAAIRAATKEEDARICESKFDKWLGSDSAPIVDCAKSIRASK